MTSRSSFALSDSVAASTAEIAAIASFSLARLAAFAAGELSLSLCLTGAFGPLSNPSWVANSGERWTNSTICLS